MTIEDHARSSPLPRTERPDAPAYLSRHLARRAGTDAPPDPDVDESVPLYLRRFREREHRSDTVMYDGSVIGASRAWAEVSSQPGTRTRIM